MPEATPGQSKSALRHYQVVTAGKSCPLCMAKPGETCRVQAEDGSWGPAKPWMQSIHVERAR